LLNDALGNEVINGEKVVVRLPTLFETEHTDYDSRDADKENAALFLKCVIKVIQIDSFLIIKYHL